MERERDIEQWLRRKVTDAGGLFFKFTSPGNDGVPDRLVVMGGRVVFVELKQEGGKPRPLQEWQIARLRRAGADVRVVAGMEEARTFWKEVMADEVHTT